MNREFSYKDALKFGANAFIDNFKLCLYASFIIACIGGLSLIVSFASIGSLGTIYNTLSSQPPYVDVKALFAAIHVTVPFILITLLQIILWSFMYAGLTKFYLHIVDNKSPKLSDIFSFDMTCFKYLIASILYYTLVFMGLLLFIFPGLYIAMNYYATQYLVIDKKLGILESFAKSSEYTDGLKEKLFFFEILLGILSYLIGIGFVTVIPFSLARIFVYRKYILAQETMSDNRA